MRAYSFFFTIDQLRDVYLKGIINIVAYFTSFVILLNRKNEEEENVCFVVFCQVLNTGRDQNKILCQVNRNIFHDNEYTNPEFDTWFEAKQHNNTFQ